MEKKEPTFNIEVIKMSAHLPIDIQPNISSKWVLNGINNSNYTMVKDSYDDSPTNSSIINSYISYIYADGLVDINAETELTKKTNISKHLSKTDARLICQDYKMYGAYAVQVIWNRATKPEDKKPILIKYFKVFKLGLNINEEMDVNGYWYSFDWTQQSKYTPKLYPKYTGEYKGNDVELLVIQRPTSNDFFSQPDWISGLRWAQVEGELQNWSYKHLMNGFQGAKIINNYNGIPTPELQREYNRQMTNALQGTDKSNTWIMAYHKNSESKGTEVIEIPNTGLNEQYIQFGIEAREALIAAHSASPVIFANTQGGGGLANNADEIEMATAMTYRKTIRPMQEVILDGLSTIFMDINPEIELAFQDFATFSGDKREDVAGDETNDKQIIN